ncbi:hypothetical protein [Caldisalinibacter kiritimatiensis]|uniref:Uncharacterized protein n=1 Tax=Caldisalinibacter kiritimatiensis TaxID=1304284 RepID=R1AQG4_9FIRM|nr:hypothetical protein [Caldisalinibacter kiritimatiensis]EOC99367.1 hypothetical protein L21TH_2625 [Caldisalinibacter kiritimatiensis]
MSNSKRIYWLFRCTEKKYANSFCTKGTIKLNTPRTWVQHAKDVGLGRGDLLEGAFCSYAIKDIQSFLKFRNLRNNLESEFQNGLTYLRSANVIDLPTFCLYGLYDSSFKERYFNETKRWAKVSYVKIDYFRDFYKYESREAINLLKEEEQPVFIIIKSPNEFFRRILKFFESIGISNKEILIKPVDYIDKQQPYLFRGPAPYELFIKDKRFINQSELRIVLNTQNNKVLKGLEEDNFIINIGDLSDITEIHPYYLEDMLIEYDNMTLRFNLSEPIVTKFEDMTVEELMKLRFQLVKGYYDNISSDEQQKAIEDVDRIFKEKFNLYHHYIDDIEY